MSFDVPQEDYFKLVKISINTNRLIGEVVRDAVCEYLKTADVQITEFEKRLMQIKGLNFD